MIPEHISGTPAEASELDSGVALLSEMVAESGPVESMQLAAWILSACVALVVLIRRRRPRERLFAGWLGLVSLLAAFREVDGHILLNPETLGAWGVRYRIDWWLSLDAPVLPRLLWAAGGAVILFGLVVPAIKVAPRWCVLTRGLDRAWWLFGASVGALFVGYACDDLIGRGLLVDPVYTKIIEESFELIGAAVFLLGVALMLHLSLSTREQQAADRLRAT
ncbi:MAG: hypothetical protein EA378_09685 [Phycisphaerales bacterium]|nr:MAG: hypothetical protein EA378_09685 [Phycisphaerales bacterium]